MGINLLGLDVQHLPPLIDMGVHDSKHIFELLNFFSSMFFGENGCSLFIGGIMFQVDCILLYMISNDMDFMFICFVQSCNMGLLDNLIAKCCQ